MASATWIPKDSPGGGRFPRGMAGLRGNHVALNLGSTPRHATMAIVYYTIQGRIREIRDDLWDRRHYGEVRS